MTLVGIPERRQAFEQAVREGTYGRMRMALYALAPSLIVQSGALEDEVMGCYDARFEVITIDRFITLDDKKCVLVHELAHWVYNDDSRPPYGAKREHETRRLTAMTLIDETDYRRCEAMYGQNRFLIADELGVRESIVSDYQHYVLDLRSPDHGEPRGETNRPTPIPSLYA